MTNYHTGSEWARFVRVARPIIKASLPRPCVNACGQLVHPHQRWHVGHLPGFDRALTHEPPSLHTVGPAHARCNTQAGQKLGQQLRAKRVARDVRQSRLLDRRPTS
jgi:hypothetical protein